MFDPLHIYLIHTYTYTAGGISRSPARWLFYTHHNTAGRAVPPRLGGTQHGLRRRRRAVRRRGVYASGWSAHPLPIRIGISRFVVSDVCCECLKPIALKPAPRTCIIMTLAYTQIHEGRARRDPRGDVGPEGAAGAQEDRDLPGE